MAADQFTTGLSLPLDEKRGSRQIHSPKAGITAFNGYHDEGRQTAVLRHLQHACEMLLKAVLSQKREAVFDKVSGRSLTFETCVRRCIEAHGLTAGQAGIMRSVNKLCDAEQHWIVQVEEGMLSGAVLFPTSLAIVSSEVPNDGRSRARGRGAHRPSTGAGSRAEVDRRPRVPDHATPREGRSTMMVRLNPEVALHLQEAVDREGTAPDELASQAVAVWSQLSPVERRQTGLFGMGLVMRRMHDDGEGGRQ